MNKRQVNFEDKEAQVMSTTATDKSDLEQHRIATFEELGFSKKNAEKLANAKHRTSVAGKNYDFPLNWHYVKKMLDNGCDHKLALKILL
jgi:hypothetical protein